MIVKKWSSFFVLVCLLGLLTGCVGTSDGRGSLSGKIYDGDENPIADAVVTLDGKSGSIGNSGYAFINVRSGTRRLKVVAPGYKVYEQTINIAAGEDKKHDVYLTRKSFFIDEVLVPGGTGFPIGPDDTEICTEEIRPFYMATHEVTYELWKEVWDWATTRSVDRYHLTQFARPGWSKEPTLSPQHPVTNIRGDDAIVWCNALTEYHNEVTGGDLDCVYLYNGQVVRDARNTNESVLKNVTANNNASGYRLPRSMEWELAARYQDGVTWTPGSHVSGDSTGPIYSNAPMATPSAVFGDYAWHSGNSGNSTHEVGTKKPNHLGIYDMSGNVREYCIDPYQDPKLSGRNQVARGGCWSDGSYLLELGYVTWGHYDAAVNWYGFRVVRGQTL